MASNTYCSQGINQNSIRTQTKIQHEGISTLKHEKLNIPMMKIKWNILNFYFNSWLCHKFSCINDWISLLLSC